MKLSLFLVSLVFSTILQAAPTQYGLTGRAPKSSIALGQFDIQTMTNSANAVFIGWGGAGLAADNAVAIGDNAVANTNSVCVGSGTLGNGLNSICLGQQAESDGDYNICIGYQAGAGTLWTNCIIMGTAQDATADNMVVLGSAAPASTMIKGYGVFTGNGAGLTNIMTTNMTPAGGSSALAGQFGEYKSTLVAVGSAVGLTTTTPANVATLSLTTGDWDVQGNINVAAASATITATVGGITTTTATIPTDGSEVQSGVIGVVISETDGIALPRKQFVVTTATTNVFLVGRATFSAGTVTAYGSITARRVR